MAFTRAALTVIALAALAACSNETGSATGEQGAQARAALARVGAMVRGGRGAAQAQPPELTRATLAAVQGPVIQLEILNRPGAKSLMFPGAANGSAVTWVTGQGQTLTTRGGLLVATRGLGADLMAADVGGLATALARGGGKYRRDLVFLDGEDQTVTLRPLCVLEAAGPETLTLVQLSYDTIRYEESCIGADGLAFSSVYWAQGGQLRASQQWAGRILGRLQISVLQ